MNKSDLIDAMAADAGITKVQAKAALDSFTSNVSKSLADGGRVSLVGFGSFSTAERKARQGINPQTKKPIPIAAKTVAKFKAGSELSDAVNATKKKKKK
ncbi:MAG: HU family DNA-binding protein [Flavobacteriaceae bacterium]|nr:HU family DNA-binding protein [Flavobacteriaceae bacterium]